MEAESEISSPPPSNRSTNAGKIRDVPYERFERLSRREKCIFNPRVFTNSPLKIFFSQFLSRIFYSSVRRSYTLVYSIILRRAQTTAKIKSQNRHTVLASRLTATLINFGHKDRVKRANIVQTARDTQDEY